MRRPLGRGAPPAFVEEEDGQRVVLAEGGVGGEQRAEGGGRVEAVEGEQGGEGDLD